MIVLNATPLIFLSRVQKLEYIIQLYDTIYLPLKVYEEVVIQGKKTQKLEANLIEEYINERKIIVKKVKIKEASYPNNLHQGEIEAIQLARDLQSKILIDDRSAYNFCKFLNLDVIRTIKVLIEICIHQIIDKSKLKNNIARLTNEGFWIGSDILARIEEFLIDF